MVWFHFQTVIFFKAFYYFSLFIISISIIITTRTLPAKNSGRVPACYRLQAARQVILLLLLLLLLLR